MAARIHMKATPRRSKYRAKPTDYRGITFASKAEAARAAELDLLRAAGEVRWWTRQVPFWLGDALSKAVIDFLVCKADGSVHGEEIKGFETAKFRNDRQRWMRHGPFDLWVIRRGKLHEIVEGPDATAGGSAAGTGEG